MIRLTDEEIDLCQDNMDLADILACEHAIAQAQLKKVHSWGDEPCPHSHTIPAIGNIPPTHLHKRACDKCWQALLEETK